MNELVAERAVILTLPMPMLPLTQKYSNLLIRGIFIFIQIE